MAVVFQLGLLLSLLVAKEVAAADLTYYTPQLTLSPIAGKVTASTFVLESPRCVFNPTSTNYVYLVVARSTANIPIASLGVPLTSSVFSNNSYFHIKLNPESSYPCLDTADYIRIGADAGCTDDYCNGPLPSGTYKVTFVVLGTANVLISRTSWSNPITLRTAKAFDTIDTWPGGRSGGMIVITSILSIILAGFLAGLVGTIIIGSKSLSLGNPVRKDEPIPQAVDIKNYKIHSKEEPADIYSQPVA